MILRILSSSKYEDKNHNHGDCIVCIKDNKAVIYDCGSEEHARKAIEILDNNKIEKATVILSHNDSDHFDGIPFLIERNRVEKLFTILLLKYKDKILDKVADHRRNRDSIGETIKEIYDNIASLSRKTELKDIYENSSEIPEFCTFIGPDFDYLINAVAKGIDSRQGNTIDKETIVNATSIQLEITHAGSSALLTGDCTPEAIPETVNLKEYDYIQLPHHGKYASATSIFTRNANSNQTIYFVSDNTGTSNGGSDELMRNAKGYRIKNTKTDGDICFNLSSSRLKLPYSGKSLGR